MPIKARVTGSRVGRSSLELSVEFIDIVTGARAVLPDGYANPNEFAFAKDITPERVQEYLRQTCDGYEQLLTEQEHETAAASFIGIEG